MNLSNSDSSDISDGNDALSKRRKDSSVKSSARPSTLRENQTSHRSSHSKGGFVLDDEDEKSNINSKDVVSGTLIQHELNFFEFETKMRKVMYDIIEPNIVRV